MLHVYQSHRQEDLLGDLAARMLAQPLPPLAAETIVVPTQGLARWLELQLATAHGIAAGLRCRFPGAFLAELIAEPRAGASDPFARELLHLRLYRLLGEPRHAAALGPAADYVRDDPDGRRRFQLAARLAAAFDDYQLYRGDLLDRAAAGDNLPELGEPGRWQAALWRLLLADAEPASADPRPAAPRGRRGDATPLLFQELAAPTAPRGRLTKLRALLADPAQARPRLPARLWVFGAATLPPAFLALLQQIGGLVPVHLYTPLPTPEFFGDLRARRREGNPLLARLGTLAREFADQLVDLEATAQVPVEQTVLREAPAPDQDQPSLLQRLQADIAAVHDRHGTARHRLDAADTSVQVHDCHSPQRELEVVRDQLLHAFANDADFQPHEALVLVPDISTYAPYAEAVFGPVRQHLPYQVADRDPASDLSLCASLLAVLALAEDRVQVFDVLRLGEEPALRRRFHLQAADLPVLRHWCEQAGIRWGLDAGSRAAQFALPAFDENSWHQGLERLLLGVVTGPLDELVLGQLPAADATTGRLDLLERFLAFLRTLFGWLPRLREAQPPTAWADRLDQLLADLYAPDVGEDQLALQRLQRATASLRARAAAARLDEPWSPAVLQAWLRQELQTSASSRGFLTGAVTIAALQPMRTVPVRRLFLCGMADQAFPRRDQPLPFDWLALQRRPGDRSVRLDDRQLFLDALLAARSSLHITFVGHSAKDDSVCAPSPVLDELLDTIDRSCQTADGRPARQQVVVRHPLQPWSSRYRDRSDPRLFTYAAAARGDHPGMADPAVFAATPVAPPPELLAARLPLERLLQFWKHPSRFFLEEVLRLRLPRDDDQERDAEAFAVDSLDRWRLQDPLVRRALRGEPPLAEPLATLRASGLLPVGGLGAIAGEEVLHDARAFLDRVLKVAAPHVRRVEVAVGEVVLHGELDGLGTEFAVQARLAKLKAKDRLRTWILHLVTSAARAQGQPDLPRRRLYHARDRVLELPELAPDEAQGHLAALLQLYQRGLAAPLPLFERSSFAFAEALQQDQSGAAALRAARAEWRPSRGDAGSTTDGEDTAYRLAWRGRDPLQDPDFATVAEQVWSPFLAVAKDGEP